MLNKIKKIFKIEKYQGISSDEIPKGSWEYDELNLTSSGDPFRDLQPGEVLDFGKRRWQASSGSCVAQTCALIHDKATGYETSAVPIYSARSNKPAQGMAYEDVVKLLPSKRIYFEKNVPSQNLNDTAMDSQNIKGDSLNPVFEPFLLPRSFDEVAKAVRQQGYASVWFRGTFDEWQQWIISSLASQSNQVRHSFAILEAIRVDGIEYLIALDSAGYYRSTSKKPSWLKTDGLRAITREAFEQGAFNQWTVKQINIIPPIGKPQYKFNYSLKYGMLKNDDVRKLQQVLIYEGLLDSDANTGNYKNMTRSAVKAFQLKHKVASVQEITQLAGVSVGPKTRAKLNELYA